MGGAWGHVTACACPGCPAHVSSCRSPTGWMEKKIEYGELSFSKFNICQQIATDALALGPVHTNTI